MATCCGGSGRGGDALEGAGAFGRGGMTFGVGARGSAVLGGGSGAGGRAGLPSGAFSSGLSGAMSTMSGSPRLAYSGAPSVLTQTSEPSSRTWRRIEQTTATANARRAGSAGKDNLTTSDYAMADRAGPYLVCERDQSARRTLASLATEPRTLG